MSKTEYTGYYDYYNMNSTVYNRKYLLCKDIRYAPFDKSTLSPRLKNDHDIGEVHCAKGYKFCKTHSACINFLFWRCGKTCLCACDSGAFLWNMRRRHGRSQSETKYNKSVDWNIHGGFASMQFGSPFKSLLCSKSKPH